MEKKRYTQNWNTICKFANVKLMSIFVKITQLKKC